VSRVRYERNGCSCTLTDGKEEYRFQSSESLSAGTPVAVEGEVKGKDIDATVVVMLSEEKADEAIRNVEANLKSSLVVPPGPALLKDEITERLWDSIKDAALELLCARKLGRNALLRFHGDADGISGAFALTGVLRCKAFQQNSAVYGIRDALRDISTVGQEGRALVILLDFASNDESQEAVGLLKAAGIKVLVIDHHPPGQSPPENLLNPLMISPGTSRYTAGYLACEVAIACGMDAERGRELAKIACTGDKSDIIEHTDEDRKKAMVLDYLAAHISFGNNLDFYRKVMGNKSLFASIAQQAKESIEEAADKAMAKMKKTTEDGLEIAAFPLDGIVTKGEWPPAGKITTCIFERLSRDSPLFCIGYTENSLIMRLNAAAAEKGLSANELARSIRESMEDFVVGGGGHDRAGAIRVKSGFARDVLNELLREAVRRKD